MKINLKIALFFLIVLLFGLGASACMCDHEYSWETVTFATCKNTGKEIGTCKLCGQTTEKETAKGIHTYKETVLEEATCSKQGTKQYVCSNCNDSYTSKYSKKNAHSYTEQILTPATCAKDGTKQYSCSECGDTYTKTYEDKSVHVYAQTIVTYANCSTQGVKKFTCTGGCGAYYTETYDVQEYTASEIYNVAKNSVVEIKTYDKAGNAVALGTGFVYSEDGKIITNYHVIRGAYTVKVTVETATYTVKTVLAYDKDVDIAVLKINASGLTPLYVCTEPVAVGETVYAIGSSQGLTDTFSQGMVSYANRVLDGVTYIQHTAAISNGNSGGPLLNSYCEVIGINTMSVVDSQNLNFAIFVTELSGLSYANPLTPAELYEKESSASLLLANYIMTYGEYDSAEGEYVLDLGYKYSDGFRFSFGVGYDAKTELVVLICAVTDGDNLVCITMVDIPLDGSQMVWGYLDAEGSILIGEINPSTFNSSSTLSISDYEINGTSSLSTLRELATTLVKLSIVYFDEGMASKGVGIGAVDIGFINFA